MKNFAIKILISLSIGALILTALPLKVDASAGVSVSASKTSVNIGDTVTVNISFSGSKTIGAIDGSYSYNSGILSYSSDTFGGGGTGKLVLTSSSASITFKAIKAGTATVSVNGSVYALEPDESGNDLLGTASGGVSITVKSPTPTPAPTPKASTTTPTTPVAPVEPEVDPMDSAIEVPIGEAKWYLWPDLTDVAIPQGFEKGESKYGETPIQVARQFGLSLAYLTDEKGENGTFWMYSEGAKAFHPYTKVNLGGSYVILQEDESVEVPEGYAPTTLELNGQYLNGWRSDEEDLKDFILLYAMNEKGEVGFYSYDTLEGTMQRFRQRIVEVEVEVEPEPEPITRQIFGNPILAGIFSSLGLLAAALAAALAHVIRKNKNKVE